MDADAIRKKLEAALEQLASVEHERWSHWQRHIHDKAQKQPDRSLVLPANLVE